MTRDYKYRANTKKKTPSQTVAWWKWLLIMLFIGLFAYFLMSIRNRDQEENDAPAQPLSNAPDQRTIAKKKSTAPKFDFYTILPEKEVVVPDYEITTRKKTEKVGNSQTTQYIMQAGSFRNYADADSMKARLALMGIESRIERAKIGNIIWNRIKIGPFSKISSVDRIRSKLRQNKIDVIVTEIES